MKLWPGLYKKIKDLYKLCTGSQSEENTVHFDEGNNIHFIDNQNPVSAQERSKSQSRRNRKKKKKEQRGQNLMFIPRR